MPRGVTGNTSDSGSEESWFDPRRGNYSEGWPSGLRRRPAKALTRKGLVGSNPTPSACGRSPSEGVGFEPRVEPPVLRILGSPSARWRGPRLRIPPRADITGHGRGPPSESRIEVAGRASRPGPEAPASLRSLGGLPLTSRQICSAAVKPAVLLSAVSLQVVVGHRCSDGWPSGLRRTIGNRVGSRPRGFESHPVR